MSATATVAKFNKPADQMKEMVTPEVVTLNPLLGTWVNMNAATRGIVKMVLIDKGDVLAVHAFGACSPTPCDWGQVPARAYAASVSGGPAMAFSANYQFGFKRTILSGHLDGHHLIVEDFNVFKDGSGRSPYFSQGMFKKRSGGARADGGRGCGRRF